MLTQRQLDLIENIRRYNPVGHAHTWRELALDAVLAFRNAEAERDSERRNAEAITNQMSLLSEMLETIRRERDLYLAVLEGAEYPNITSLKDEPNAEQLAPAIGKNTAIVTQIWIARAMAAEAELAALHDGSAQKERSVRVE